ncbi:NADPH:quinone oxidoreductase family protein [Azohydromonas sp.]|uniref:NADPH:quinone oxidoreductase family protein n=1 Tax=Azohydromonas sp. TaxID=1872666 RepID=UPI002B7D6100|nr:NADPH:quinone oxidoreductase family protein [Azohydromonas sp.]HMM85748.1 NADPH:quinone oxidoreductase family protein [Azohydromonas sp.]
MQGWLCETLDGVDALQWREMPTPQPQAGQVRVAIHAASLNFPDLLIVEGKYQMRPPLPFVPGSEFSGRVDAVGPGVETPRVGDAVAVIGSHGGFATHALVDASRVIPLPPGFALDDAAAFAFTYGTAHHALIDRGQLRAGETVLVLGAAGGVGTAAVQVAKAAGARVIAAASNADKCALCREIGADETIDYGREDLRERLKALTGSRGLDVVYDPVGGALAEPALRAVGWRGRYLVIGFAGGTIPALPWNLPLLKGSSIVGVFWGEFVRREPQAFAVAMRELAQWHAQGKVKPVIDQRLPMSALRDAYARMASRQVRGKVLLVNR